MIKNHFSFDFYYSYIHLLPLTYFWINDLLSINNMFDINNKMAMYLENLKKSSFLYKE